MLSIKNRALCTAVFTALATLALVLNSSVSYAIAIVDDTWADGTDTDPASPTYSEYGVDSEPDGDLESAWFQGGNGTLDPVGAGGPLRAAFTGPTITSSASWTTYFAPANQAVTLANTGDFLRVTWVFSLSNVNTGNTSQNFRFAVVDSPEAARLAANGSPAGGQVYPGYGVFANMGQTLGNSNPFQLRERNAVTSQIIDGSGSWDALGNGATSTNTGYVADETYTMVFEFTRNGSSLDIDVSVAGGNLDNDGLAQVTFSDASPNTFSFDTFHIRPSGATTTAEIFDFSRVLVETNVIVPEPASFVLLGLALPALLVVRRRRTA